MNMRRCSVLAFLMVCLSFSNQIFGLETSRHIARIVEQLSCNLPEEGTFRCDKLGINRSLYIERQGDAITQIGLRLFTHDMRKEMDGVVCDAVERLFLELALCSDVNKQKALLREYRSSLVLNGFALGLPQFTSFRRALDIISSDAALSMNAKEGKIVLRIKSSDDALVITLPADRELLFAYDKKEHEDVLRESLEQWRGDYVRSLLPALNELQQLEGGIYVLPGAAYMIDSLRSNTYYTIDNGRVRPLFNRDEPLKSFQNLLMGMVSNSNVDLYVRYRTYDRAKKYCSMPLDHFLGYMQSQGVVFYSAAYHTEEGQLQGLLLMHHPLYDYIHMLVVNGDTSVYTGEQVVLKGDFYTFIPQHNIKSLFNF